MKDMMMNVYNALKSNSLILEKVTPSGIKFFEVPETFDTSKPFIIVDSSLGPQTTAYFSADKEMAKEFRYQINVETTNRLLTKEISQAVNQVMRENGFTQLSGGLDTYFPETKRFVDARRYQIITKIHDTDY